MSDSLRQKTFSGIVWSLLEQFSTTGIAFIFGLYLARLLAPADFGIIAMMAVFLAVSQCFIDGGVVAALIRKTDLSEQDKATGFFFNIAVALVCYAVLFFAAPFIAAFYEIPILCPTLRVIGLNLIINSLRMVPSVALFVSLNFRAKAKIALAAVLVSSPLAVLAAYAGWGVWALVCQSLSSACVSTLLYYWVVRWRPRTGFSRESFRYIFSFGSRLLASSLLDTIYRNLYTIIIGKFFSASTLSYYARASHFTALPSSILTGALQRVSYPALSALQHERERLITAYRKFLRLSAFVSFPLIIGLAAVAEPLILVLLTGKWAPCVPYLQIICFAAMWYAIHAINLNLLQVQGRSDLFLRLEIIKKILGVSMLFLTVPFGLMVMCYGLVACSCLSLFLNTYYTRKLYGLGIMQQLRDILPILLNSLVMFALACGVQPLFEEQYLRLIFGVLVGGGYYILFNMLLRTREWREAWSILRNRSGA